MRSKTTGCFEQYRQFVAVCSGESDRKGLMGLALFLAAGSRLCVAGAKTETRTCPFSCWFFAGITSFRGVKQTVNGIAAPEELFHSGAAALASVSSSVVTRTSTALRLRASRVLVYD